MMDTGKQKRRYFYKYAIIGKIMSKYVGIPINCDDLGIISRSSC